MHNSSQISDIPSMTLDVDGPRPSASEQALEVTRAETRLETSDKITLNLSCSLGAFPASSMMSLAGADEAVNPAYRPDLISCGVISLEAADNYLAFYKTHLDPEVHCVLTENDTLADVRARSSLLTAAICTVASFCSGSEDYQRCFSAFTDAVSRKLFSTTYEFDDVRALCIGAFWLNDVCSVLNGLGKYCMIVASGSPDNNLMALQRSESAPSSISTGASPRCRIPRKRVTTGLVYIFWSICATTTVL